MAWDVRQTYYYLVCFATLLMVMIGAVQVVRAGLDLALPDEPYRPTPFDLQERFMRPRVDTMAVSIPSRAELEQITEEEVARQLRANRRRALRQLLSNLALILIAVPVYVYHWRQVRKE